MRKLFCILTVLIIFIFSGCTIGTFDGNETTDNNLKSTDTEFVSDLDALPNTTDEFIAVWIPIYEIAPKSSFSEKDYKDYLDTMFAGIKNFGINNVFVQVRANCDSIYPSKYFSLNSSYTKINGTDALTLIIEAAHKYNIKVHAWINPYRIASSGEYNTKNKIFSFINQNDISTGENYAYIKPSSVLGRKLILSGVKEILETYDVDGIHIDDYFFPTTKEEFDKDDYDSYILSGGTFSREVWRRENVNILVSSMYSTVKSYGENYLFSISPGGNINKNYNESYADTELWCKSDGYADIIIPQLYFGFENSSQPFEKVLKKWKKLTKKSSVKLVVGLAVYKAGTEDEYAGSGKNEWIDNQDVIKRQIEVIRKNKLEGFSFFSYNYIFSNNYLKNKEITNIKSVL